LQGGAYTVVRATQQVNGNGNFGVSERNH